MTSPCPDLTEAARAFTFKSAWEARFERYERLLHVAGKSPEEATAIVTAAMLDELAETAEYEHELEGMAA